MLYSISMRPEFLRDTPSGAKAVSTMDAILTIVTGWADQQHSPHPLREIVRSCQCIGAAPTEQQRNVDSLPAVLYRIAGSPDLFWQYRENTPKTPYTITKQGLMPSYIGNICRVICKAL